MTLLVLSLSYEPATDDILSRLNLMEVDWIRVNMNDFLTTGNCSLSGDGQFEIRSHGKLCNSESITAVWYRKYAQDVNLPIPLNAGEALFIRRELGHFWRAAFDTLISKPWVNPYAATMATKPEQLRVAHNVGLRIPETIVSNDPQRVREFISEHNNDCIVKPISSPLVLDFLTCHIGPSDVRPVEMKRGPIQSDNVKPNICFTEAVSVEDLSDSSISFSPAIYQERIPKAAELRITVIGDTVFPAIIYSQEGHLPEDAAAIDWRRNPALKSLPHLAVELPAHIRDKVLQFMNAMRLVFACLDIIVTPDGEYVFLEANPAGQWGWVEGITGQPITDTLAEFLRRVTLEGR